MAKAERDRFDGLDSEALLEAFLLEAKLADPAMPFTVAEINEHRELSYAYGDEIVARGGARSLIALLSYPEDWIAYCAAEALLDSAATKEVALATLDRIAEECSGTASSSADTARNMIRYGNPLGAEWVGRM